MKNHVSSNKEKMKNFKLKPEIKIYSYQFWEKIYSYRISKTLIKSNWWIQDIQRPISSEFYTKNYKSVGV